MDTYHVTVRRRSGFAHEASMRGHSIISDEPADVGGEDAGPVPWELLLAAMGTCTAITLEMYAERKGWKLRNVSVEATRDKQGGVAMSIEVEGDLDEEQRARLELIAGKCPVVK